MLSQERSSLKVSYLPADKLHDDNGVEHKTHIDLWPTFQSSAINVLSEEAHNIAKVFKELIGRELKTEVLVFSGKVKDDNLQTMSYNADCVGGETASSTIYIELLSGRSLNEQLHDYKGTAVHEWTHRILHPRVYVTNNEMQPFHHHAEHTADAGIAHFYGTEVAVKWIRDYAYEGDSETHPSTEKRIYALENSLYKGVFIQNMQDVRNGKLSIQGGFKDFRRHQEKYLSTQGKINAAVMDRF